MPFFKVKNQDKQGRARYVIDFDRNELTVKVALWSKMDTGKNYIVI